MIKLFSFCFIIIGVLHQCEAQCEGTVVQLGVAGETGITYLNNPSNPPRRAFCTSTANPPRVLRNGAFEIASANPFRLDDFTFEVNARSQIASFQVTIQTSSSNIPVIINVQSANGFNAYDLRSFTALPITNVIGITLRGVNAGGYWIIRRVCGSGCRVSSGSRCTLPEFSYADITCSNSIVANTVATDTSCTVTCQGRSQKQELTSQPLFCQDGTFLNQPKNCVYGCPKPDVPNGSLTCTQSSPGIAIADGGERCDATCEPGCELTAESLRTITCPFSRFGTNFNNFPQCSCDGRPPITTPVGPITPPADGICRQPIIPNARVTCPCALPVTPGSICPLPLPAGTSCQVQCRRGFILQGDDRAVVTATTTCGDDGMFESLSCIGTCRFPSYEDATVLCNCDGRYLPQAACQGPFNSSDTCRVTCDPGYMYTNEDTMEMMTEAEVTCLNGRFDEEFECEVIHQWYYPAYCALANADVTCAPPMDGETNCTVMCEHGYYLDLEFNRNANSRCVRGRLQTSLVCNHLIYYLRFMGVG